MILSPGWRAAGFGAALFFLIGIQLPYLPVWMEEARGLSGVQITAIVSAATLLRVIVGPLLAAEAERSGLRRKLIQLSLVMATGYGFLTQMQGFGTIALFAIVIYVSWGVLNPLTEALLLASTKTGQPDYGRARSLASAVFVVASLATGIIGACVRAGGHCLCADRLCCFVGRRYPAACSTPKGSATGAGPGGNRARWVFALPQPAACIGLPCGGFYSRGACLLLQSWVQCLAEPGDWRSAYRCALVDGGCCGGRFAGGLWCCVCSLDARCAHSAGRSWCGGALDTDGLCAGAGRYFTRCNACMHSPLRQPISGGFDFCPKSSLNLKSPL